MKLIINPSHLSGTINVPPSKSHTMRAILFASLASGESIIHNYLISPDTTAMINACTALGARIKIEAEKLTITGTAGKLSTADNIIDAGNSGQVLRFIAALAALIPDYTIITGDQSIRNNRPIQPLLNAIQQLGGFAVSSKQNGYAPVIIKGSITGGFAEVEGEDSQPISGLLIAAAFLPNMTELKVYNPGETPWIDLTLDWFKRLGIEYECDRYTYYKITGKSVIKPFEYTVPSDFSSAAFPIVAALITGSEISLSNIDMQDVQGDKAIIPALQNLGANIFYEEDKNLLHIKKSENLMGGIVDINNFIDAVTILGVFGCFVSTPLKITGASIANKKESKRLSAITQELTKMRAKIAEQDDGLLIEPSQLHGAELQSHHDHRMAMSLAVAALAASGTTIIHDSECIAKSFANFVPVMQKLGANIQEVK